MDNVKNIGTGFVIVEKRIELPKGKTTTEGDYSKLADDEKCAYPERASCNYGNFFNRCEFMECISMGHWECANKKK